MCGCSTAFLLLMMFSLLRSNYGNVILSEFYALQDLYAGTNGDMWTYGGEGNDVGNQWNFTDYENNNPCMVGVIWAGVMCESDCMDQGIDCHVTSLNLVEFGLWGTLSDSISSLPALEAFIVSHNSISHTIPTIINELSNLESLSLNLNILTGEIPNEICVLTKLETLDLSGNRLLSTIPSCMNQLLMVSSLMINFNSLHSTIPTSIGQLTALQLLALASNSLTGPIPTEIGNLSRLRVLSFASNALTGLLPSDALCALVQPRSPDPAIELENFTNLEFPTNFLEGTIPDCLFEKDSNLRRIFLSNNLLTGTIYELNTKANVHSSVSTFTETTNTIEYLDISDNHFTGNIPFVLPKWNRMIIFNISHNDLEGRMVISSNLTELMFYDISNNWLSGTISREVVNMHLLYELIISNNYISGTIPTEVGDVPGSYNFYVLDFGYNMISGTIPTTMAVLTSVTTFLVGSNHLHGTISDQFTNPDSYLQVLDLSNNGFTGSIPTEIFALPRLLAVAISENCFTGSIPTTICDANKLQVLDMDGLSTADDCTFSSPLMKDIAIALQNTQVYRAKFMDGGLPQCFFQMANLSSLYLAGNGLIGTIPELEETSGLETISLSHNRFYGTIPQSIQLWSKMISLDLSFNRLSGTVSNMNYSSKMVIDPNAPPHAATVGDTISFPFLGLKSNRLSGEMPSFFTDLTSLDVLSGNLFDCSLGTLPRNDPAYDSYWCASMYLYSMWGAVLSVFVLSVAFVFIVGVILRLCFSEDVYADASVILRRIRSMSYINELGKMEEDGERDRVDSSNKTSACWPLWTAIKWLCYTAHTFIRGFVVTLGRVFIKVIAFPPGVISSSDADVGNTSDTIANNNSNNSSNTQEKHPFVFPLSKLNDKLLLMGDTASTKYNKDKYDTSKMHREIVNVIYLFVTMRRFAVFVLVVSVLIFLPTYSLLKTEFDSSTHTYQYGWFLSLAYLQSAQSGLTILVLWSVFLGSVALLCVFTEARRIYIRLFVAPPSKQLVTDEHVPLPLRSSMTRRESEWNNNPQNRQTLNENPGPKPETTKNYTTYYLVKIYLLLLILLNCLFMVILNGIYIFLQFTQTPLVAAISLYVFVAVKTVWNVKVVPWLLRSRPKRMLKAYYMTTRCIRSIIWNTGSHSQQQPTDYRYSTNRYESIAMTEVAAGENEEPEDYKRSDIRSGATHCMLLIFNNIIAPAIATFFSDSNCINSLIISPKPIESSFQYPLCVDMDANSLVCNEFKLNVLKTDFDPPFMYSFQCGSSLLTNYVPVFLLMYGIGGILVPCIQWLTVIVLEYYWRNEIFEMTGRKYVIGGTKKERIRLSETALHKKDNNRSISGDSSVSGEELVYEVSDDTPQSSVHFTDSLKWNSGYAQDHEHVEPHRDNEDEGVPTLQSSVEKRISSSCNPVIASDNVEIDKEEDTDSDQGRDSLGSNMTVETNNSEKQETDRQLRRDKLAKSIKFYQKMTLYCTFGMISEMHWPILFCPDLASTKNPDDPNNLYRIQNMTCGAITGIAVLMTFGVSYPPLAVVIAFMICSTTYLLQSIITNHLNYCSEHQTLVREKHRRMAAEMQRKNQEESMSYMSLLPSGARNGQSVGEGMNSAPSDSSMSVSTVYTAAAETKQTPKQLLYDLVINEEIQSMHGQSNDTGATPRSNRQTPPNVDENNRNNRRFYGSSPWNDNSFNSIYDKSFSYNTSSNGPNTMKQLTKQRHRNVINHFQLENNWYVALTAVLRKECRGLSNLLFKCSLWMLTFCALFVALFLYDMTMRAGASIFVCCVAIALSFFTFSAKAWYKEYLCIKKAKFDVHVHRSNNFNEYQRRNAMRNFKPNPDDGVKTDSIENVFPSKDTTPSNITFDIEYLSNTCEMFCDYISYCLYNYLYYYIFCGCVWKKSERNHQNQRKYSEECCSEHLRRLSNEKNSKQALHFGAAASHVEDEILVNSMITHTNHGDELSSPLMEEEVYRDSVGDVDQEEMQHLLELVQEDEQAERDEEDNIFE